MGGSSTFGFTMDKISNLSKKKEYHHLISSLCETKVVISNSYISHKQLRPKISTIIKEELWHLKL